jgi:galactokinase
MLGAVATSPVSLFAGRRSAMGLFGGSKEKREQKALEHFLTAPSVDAGQVDALKRGDFDMYLRLVRESGRSSWKLLQNIYPGKAVRDQSAALALFWCERLLAGAGACRIHGGGFGGTIQAFIPEGEKRQFKTAMEALTGSGSSRFLGIRSFGAVEIE